MGTVNANDWPAAGRPIQLTVPSPGGGGTGDTIARLLAEQLAINLKTSFLFYSIYLFKIVFYLHIIVSGRKKINKVASAHVHAKKASGKKQKIKRH